MARQRQRHAGGGALGPRAAAAGRHGRLGALAERAGKTEEFPGKNGRCMVGFPDFDKKLVNLTQQNFDFDQETLRFKQQKS